MNMTRPMLVRRRALMAVAALTALSLTCLTPADAAWKFWPFGKKPVPPPTPVEVLKVANADGSPAALKQYWVRNMLVLDMSAAGAQGMVTLGKPDTGRWPVRLGFRMLPGQFPALEVQGAQRVIVPIRADGPAPVDVALAPSAWSQQSTQLQLSWGGVTAAASSPGS